MSDLEFNEQKGMHMSDQEGQEAQGLTGGPAIFDEVADLADEGDVNYRSAETGQFVSEEEAEASPETTVKEIDKSLITEKRGIHPGGAMGKRSVLMNLHGTSANNNPYFVHLDEDGETHADGYHMPMEMWDDFGQPDTITVVVYPRDMLNN